MTGSTSAVAATPTQRRPWEWRRRRHDQPTPNSKSSKLQQQQQRPQLTWHNSNVTANTAAATTVVVPVATATPPKERDGQGQNYGQDGHQQPQYHHRGLFSRLKLRKTRRKNEKGEEEEQNENQPLHRRLQQQQQQQAAKKNSTNDDDINVDVHVDTTAAAATAAAVVNGSSSADVNEAVIETSERRGGGGSGGSRKSTTTSSSTEWMKVTLPPSSSPPLSVVGRAMMDETKTSDHRDTTFPVGAYPSLSNLHYPSSSSSSASGLRQRIHRWSRVNDVDSHTSRAGGPLGSRFESGSAASSNLSMVKQIHLHHHIQQQQQQQQQQLINSRASIDSTSMLSTVSSLTASQRQSSRTFLEGFATQAGTGDGRRRGSSAPLPVTTSSSSFRRFSSRRIRMMKKSGGSSRATSSRSFTNTAIQRYHDATTSDHDFDADEEKTTCTSSRFFATASDLNTYGNCGPGASGEFKIYVEVDSVSIVDNANQHGVYTGTLDRLNHKPHGIGTMIYSKETLVYDGQWVKGDWCGFGSLIDTKNGHTYQGGFFDNYKHGLGVLTYADGRIYECSFTLGTMELKGHLEYPDGTKYWGHWTAEGIEHGRGKKEYVDGRVFDGEFSKGIIHGHGRMTYPDGSWYLGEWMDGEQNGLGMHVKADGTLLCEGTFCHGKPIEGSSCPSTSLKSEGDFLLYRSSVAPHGTLVGNIPHHVVMRPEKWVI